MTADREDAAAPAVKHRIAGRVLVLDPDDRVLLFRGFDPADPADYWWATPGGGLSAGETPREAAARELLEETGLEIADGELGDQVFEDVIEFSFDGRRIRQRNHFFVLRTPVYEISTAGFDESERETMTEYRWWSIEEVRQTAETCFPSELADLLDRLTAQRGPEQR